MGKKFPFILATAFVLTLLLLVGFFMFRSHVPVLSPKGIIAEQERDLMITTFLLMLIVVIPVFILKALASWKFRAGKNEKLYAPHWDKGLLIETVWWGVPFIIIAVLSVMTWKSCFSLDPFKPLASERKAMPIQVVALQWKWLFIYPEQKIATVNFVKFPVDVPITFEITADAPMNSFWIPELGGQIYAMPGMRTKLHLMASEKGAFRGSSANLSGKGFASMVFSAVATSEDDFTMWVEQMRRNPELEYEKLVMPTESVPPAAYTLKEEDLFSDIVMKYMGWTL